jgi:nitroimidazol reductase NimA-like FMN-containing flavoprotein (pyridoxamine 5'-phosphate oxidase superfamily)
VPTARRPDVPRGYGIARDAAGLLEWSWAEERLRGARGYWLATASRERGAHAAPIWGLWRDGVFAFGTDPQSRKGRNLAADPRATVHLESAEEVVIVEGRAEAYETDETFLDEYEAKYAVRPPAGAGYLAIRPARAFAWIEADYPRTATRFDF